MTTATLPESAVSTAALRIGDELVRTAHWDEAGLRCNWMGRTDVEHPTPGASETASMALGAHLYAGSCGIALFLAELAFCTGVNDYQHTALGAMRRSLQWHQEHTSPASALSFYSGELGLAYTATRMDELSGRKEHAAEITKLLERVQQAISRPHPLDVMGGCAGAIPALLRLAVRPGRAECRAWAIACGVELCQRARWQGSECAWDAAEASGPGFLSTPMTGLSHGASGLAWSLLELHAATGDPTLLRTARGAFAYEDRLFMPELGNWPDTRFAGQAGPPLCQTAWCHGAAGIALARARASVLDPEWGQHHRTMAQIALTTTCSKMEEQLALPRADASLCHGLTGLAQAVHLAGEILQDPALIASASRFTRQLVAMHGQEYAWPSGAPLGGPNPSLMIGLAGIGHHLLRVISPDKVAPILLSGFE